MKHLKKILKLVNRHRTLYIIGAVITLVIIASAAAYAFSNKSQENLQKSTAVKQVEPKKDQVTKETEPMAESATTPAAPAAATAENSAAPAAQPKPQTQPKAAPAPKPAPQPVVIALTVSSIFSWGGTACSNGAMKLTLINETALYTPAGAVGGAVRWQVETMNNDGLRVGQTGIETIAPNAKRHVITGLVPSDVNSGSGAKIRLHVTSPNDVVSNWYTPTVYGSCSL